MKSIRKHRLQTHQLIRSWLQPKLGAVGARYRLTARVRWANLWAKRHPKRTFACVTGSLLLLLVGTVALERVRTDSPQTADMNAIASMEPLFTGFHAIQANKNVHRQKLLELTSQGQAVREELDSMIAIPHKSHADSMRIIQCYRQLEHIVKSLKNNDNP